MSLRQTLIACGLLAAACFSSRVMAAEPPSEPVLQIETGNHTAWVSHIATDAKSRWLATASEDKTLRVWDLQNGALLHTLRPPIGDAKEGALNSVAFSPDGNLLATAGTTCFAWDKAGCIYIFERASGRMVHHITGLSEGPAHLAWSADGKYLAAGLYGKHGVRVFRTKDYVESGRDTAYGDQVEQVDFSRDGHLVTSSRDGALRLYRLEADTLRLLEKKEYPNGKQPLGVQFAPDGATLAVGFSDTPDVLLVSAQSLALIASTNTAGMKNGGRTNVAWSADGQTLYAGSKAETPDGNNRIIRAWSKGGRGAFTDMVASQRRITDLLALAGGGVVFASNEPAWGVLDTSGKRTRFMRAKTAQFWGNQENFRLSPDGMTVRFGFEFTSAAARFNLRERHYEDAKRVDDLLAPLTAADGVVVTSWKDQAHPTINGTAVKLREGENAVALAISPDRKSVVLGTYSRMRKFDTKGRELWQKRVPATVEAVNISADSKLLVAAYHDGSIRWSRLSDGVELAAYFPHADRKRWVVWTPSGYFDASPGAEDLIGWHLNRGRDSAADFFPASRFRAQYYRPEVLAKVFETLHEADAPATRLQDMLPPVVELYTPLEGTPFSQTTVTLRYRVRVPTDAPVTALRARVNGQTVALNAAATEQAAGANAHEVRIAVPPQDSEIQLFAENRNGVSVPATLKLIWKGSVAPAKPDQFEVKPKLYVLAVGVSDYDNPEYKLGLANKDARDFASALQGQKGKLYRDVEVRLLTDKKASRDAVLDGLDWLQKQVTAKDIGMLFLAGHGFNDATGVYYFMPSNADVDKLKSTAVVFTEIKNTLSNLAGKALFFVDTCHSGNVLGGGRRAVNNDTTAIINELASAENGVVVFSSSTGKQYSLEDPKWGNGAFTKALVEGVNGKADFNHNGRITHKMLDFYLSERVKELTDGRQTPVTQAPGGVPDFPIALSR